MKTKKLTGALGFLFFLTAGVTWVSGEAGQGAEGRFALPDVVGLLLIGSWLVVGIADRRLSLRIPVEFRAYLPLLFVYLLGISFSRYPGRGVLELLIHVFIFVVALALYNLYRRLPSAEAMPMALRLLLWAGGALAVLGLVDFFLWPSLLPGSGNGLVGTFRNTGQAGAFFGMYLAILIPGFLAGLIKPTRVQLGLLLSIVFALVFTSKRAALIGLAVGLCVLAVTMLFSTSKRDKKFGLAIIVMLVFLAPLAYYAFLWGLDNIEGMAWRFGRKFNQYAVEDFQEGFLAENIAAMKTAFEINPLVGVGLGNVAGVITEKYEIHSTYLAILGNGGLLGAVAYLYFMFVHGWQASRFRGSDPYAMYLRYYIPMLVGLVIAWAYTYHLRKREFWILFLLVSLVVHAAKEARSAAQATSKGAG